VIERGYEGYVANDKLSLTRQDHAAVLKVKQTGSTLTEDR